MGKDRGWDYLNSSGDDFDFDKDDDGSWGYENEDGSGSYYGNDGSWGYKNSDGSASYYGADGSWGYRNEDGSSSYYGSDGSWGYKNSNGSGSYYGEDGDSEYYSSDDDNYRDSGSGGSLLGTLIGAGIAAFAISKLAKSSSNNVEYDSDVDGEDDYDDDDDDNDEDYYYNSEEYKERLRQEAQRRAEQEQREAEAARIRQEERKEKRRRFRGTITRKKTQVGIPMINCRGMKCDQVMEILKSQGFFNITTAMVEDLTIDRIQEEGQVEGVSINGDKDFDSVSQYPINAKIEIVCHKLQRIVPPVTSREAHKKNVNDIVDIFRKNGFVNVSNSEIADLTTGWLTKDGSVESVLIDGRSDYKRKEKIRLDANVVVTYHTFKKK